MSKICITGANGFIGKKLFETLIKSGKPIRGFVRSTITDNNKYVTAGDISSDINWKNLLIGYDCIIHCAGMAHNMKKKDNLENYLAVNTKGTKHLAEYASKAGVKRFIFLSSIKVNGEKTSEGINVLTNSNFKKKFSYNDIEAPEDSYGISKFEAEKELWKISAKTGLEVVVIRLPLVYGKGAKGNLARLIKLLATGLPLPFSLINNKRSLIGIDNLVDLIIRCVDHPSAAGKTFLVSDGEDLSTPDLIKQIAFAMGCKAKLFPFPVSLLKFFGYILGRKSEIERITGSLRVDSSHTRKMLNWSPPISVEEGIKRMILENDKGF